MAIYLEDFEDYLVPDSESVEDVADGCRLSFRLSSSDSDAIILSLPCKTIAKIIVSIVNGSPDLDLGKHVYFIPDSAEMAFFVEEYKSYIVPTTAKLRLENGGEFKVSVRLAAEALGALEFTIPCKEIAEKFVSFCNISKE